MSNSNSFNGNSTYAMDDAQVMTLPWWFRRCVPSLAGGWPA